MFQDQALNRRTSSDRLIHWSWLGCVGCQGLILLVAITLIAASFVTDRLDQSATERYLRSLDTSADEMVPPGSDRQTAEAWLISQGMRVSKWGPDLGDSAIEGHGIPPERLGGILRGDTKQQLWYGYNEVSVYFFLDKQGSVIKHQVSRSRIGL